MKMMVLTLSHYFHMYFILFSYHFHILGDPGPRPGLESTYVFHTLGHIVLIIFAYVAENLVLPHFHLVNLCMTSVPAPSVKKTQDHHGTGAEVCLQIQTQPMGGQPTGLHTRLNYPTMTLTRRFASFC